MAVVVYSSGLLLVLSMFVMAQAYFPVRQPAFFGGPCYDTPCRESIEDLKALVEVTQTIKQDTNNYSCPSCSTFTEELIMKLINALIFTATHNCGYNRDGGGHYPVGSNNVGGGNLVGGLIGGGNNIGLLAPVTGGGNTGVVNPTGTVGGTTGEGSGRGTSGKNDDGLINLGVLDGEDTLSLGLGGTKVLGVDVGKLTGGSTGEYTGSSTTGTEGTVPVNNGVGGITSPVNSLPGGEGGSIVPNNSNNLGGVTNPTNAGDVNQVNQQVNKVTNIVPVN